MLSVAGLVAPLSVPFTRGAGGGPGPRRRRPGRHARAGRDRTADPGPTVDPDPPRAAGRPGRPRGPARGVTPGGPQPGSDRRPVERRVRNFLGRAGPGDSRPGRIPPGLRCRAGTWSTVTKSMSSSTVVSSGRSRSFQDRTRPRIACQARAMSAWSACGSLQHLADARLPLHVARDVGPALQPDALRLHGLPDVDVRVAEHPDPRRRTARARRPGRCASPCCPGTRWSASTPSRRPGPGRELLDHGREVVDAAEELDDDADVAQVVAPDAFHELGVVAALDVDPAGQRDLGLVPARRGHRTARRSASPRVAAARTGACRETGRPSSRNPGPSGKLRTLPRRSSSCTIPFSQRSTAPQKPVVASSTTRSRSRVSGSLTGLRGAFQPALRTSPS